MLVCWSILEIKAVKLKGLFYNLFNLIMVVICVIFLEIGVIINVICVISEAV